MVNKKNILESLEGEVIDVGKDYIGKKIKNKVIKLGEISVLILLSFIMISIGLGQLLANLYPFLMGGYSYLILGLIFLLLGYILGL